MTNDLFHQEWANGYISSSSKKKSFKPDWVCYIKPWINRFDLVICEVKAPGKKNSGIYSDFTKLGFEMKTSINNLVSSGINSPRVFGILVEGKIEVACIIKTENIITIVIIIFIIIII